MKSLELGLQCKSVVSLVSTSWGQMKAGSLCAVWSSVVGLTSVSQGESCAGGDDEVEWVRCAALDLMDMLTV